MAEELYVITHIDLIPQRSPDGTLLLGEAIATLENYARTVAQDSRVLRFELLQQAFRKNHFEMLTVFESLGSYESYSGSEGYRQFREQLHPKLGAPFDDRLHYLYYEKN